MKTWNAKPGEVERRWYLVDAEGKTLGRLATRIADTLRGKDKAQYTPHVDTGDFVVVVNADKIVVTGKKLDDKIYYRHSGYPGGIRSRTLREELERRPTEVIRKAVKGMLPAQPSRSLTADEAQGLRRPRPSARGAGSAGAQAGEQVVAAAAQYQGTGKRKTSIARVVLRPGDGATWINGRPLEDYFPRSTHRTTVLAPLKAAGAEGTYDLRVRVEGGGPTGQAGAIRHGIARALVEADPELRTVLKREGFLTRDARKVERKKAGLHKARKAPAVLQALDARRLLGHSRLASRSRLCRTVPRAESGSRCDDRSASPRSGSTPTGPRRQETS